MMKEKSARHTIMKQKRKKRPKSGEPQRITKTVTHIRLLEANAGKLAALDALAPVYLALCQHYVTLFCTDERPNKLRDPLFPKAWKRQQASEHNRPVKRRKRGKSSVSVLPI
jgi:hypothetical protein